MADTCPQCQKTFSKSSNLKRHLREKHKDEEGQQPLVQCILCDRTFTRKEGLRIHIESIHGVGKEKECSLCNYKTINKSCLSRHVQRVHKRLFNTKPIPTDHTVKPYLCSVCKKQFKLKPQLNYHLRKKHGYIGIVPLVEKKCPLCPFSTSNANANNGNVKQNMYNHFDTIHNITLQKESLEFESPSEFDAWKSKIEEKTVTKFVKYHHKRGVISLVCHRSGSFVSKGTGKRKLKTKGSLKINGFCPAAITAYMKECGKVHVTFLKTHVGHREELKHVSLTAEERLNISSISCKNALR